MELRVSIGTLAAVTTCIVELVIVPIFEMCRNKLSAFAANRALRAGGDVVLGHANPIMHFFGVGSVIKMNNSLNMVAVVSRTLLKFLLILSVVLWESNLTPEFQRDIASERLEPDPTGERNVTLATPVTMPPHFVGNESCQNYYNHTGSRCLGNRFTRLDPNIQTKYLSECVEPIGNQSVVYYGLAVFTKSGPKITCLNGRKGAERKIFMTFNSVDARLYPPQSWRISEMLLEDDGNAEPGIGPYRSTVYVRRSDSEEDTLDGYVTFAGRTHSDNNVGRSAYGVLISRRNRTATTTSFAVTQSAEICSGELLGTWRFGEEGVYCPDGLRSHDYPEIAAVFELGLIRYDIQTQNPIQFTMQDALAWIFETPIGRFSCPFDGASEMRMRYATMELFFSYLPGTTIKVRTGTQHATTQMEMSTTVLVIAVSLVTITYSLLTTILFAIVSRKTGILSDFDDASKLLAIWLKGGNVKYHVEEAWGKVRFRLVTDSGSEDQERWTDN